MMPDKTFPVRVLGREYPLRIKSTEEALIREVTKLVQERMDFVKKSLSREPDLTISVIASISIAEELFATKRELEKLSNAIIALERALSEKSPNSMLEKIKP